MLYMGSKNRHAKHMLPVMLPFRKEGQWWVEPFVGGGNMIDKVGGPRLGADKHPHLIAMWEAVSQGWLPPEFISEDTYQQLKDANTVDALTGYVGFALSFGGKWWGGYRRDTAGSKGCTANMRLQSRRAFDSMKRQAERVRGVQFVCSGYDKLDIPEQSLIYCDPPYANTTGYKHQFDSEVFWKWCDEKVEEGHTVFVSEYNAPEGWECVWERSTSVSLDNSKSTRPSVERLFSK